MQEREFKAWLSCARDDYNSCKNLLETSKNDPQNEPYKSKYKAKDTFMNLLSQMNQWKSSDNLFIIAIRALFKYYIGVIDLETEELTSACDSLTSCWEELQDVSGKPEICTLAVSVLNQLSILWSSRGELNKALNYLEKAEELYNFYKASNENGPYTFEDLFETEDTLIRDWMSFEKLFTYTLWYLAQVCERMNENERSAKYCHETLKRQLKTKNFEHKEWAVNCATLSQYYIQEKNYALARHLLSSSTYILEIFEATQVEAVRDEDSQDDLKRSKAEVGWCWLKYCINLLTDSAEKDFPRENTSVEPHLRLSDEKKVLDMETEILCSVSNFAEARKVFLFGQNCVTEVKSYYTLDTYANNHVQAVQDYSKLYKALALHERDTGRLSKMNKRCIDMLEFVLSKMNPQYYLAVCRQLRFELGETFYEMVDLKLKTANSNPQGLSVAVIQKINSYIMHSIKHFSGFLDSLRESSGDLPETFSEDLARPALVAHFYCGRLHSKLIVQDTTEKLKNISKCEENYKFIVNYVEKNPEHAHFMTKELPVIKEMLELLPEKILQIHGSTIY
ncbi:KIF-binding protein-like [Uloborus diversus]|uniref:KIF-binding protein-like n=1 Tax=Uloborus diversus TaxID=327109 RepID=UPI00240A8D9C|nr:KIF-binding protein-like [Uloborus diversus]